MARGRERTGNAWRRKMADGSYRWYARPILADGEPGKAQMLPAAVTSEAHAKEIARKWTLQAQEEGRTKAAAPKGVDLGSLTPPHVPGVYFVACRDEVKIGHTEKTIAKRMRAMQTGNPVQLALLAYIEGAGEGEEKELHHRFWRLRTEGEWFKHEGELASFIRTLRGASHA